MLIHYLRYWVLNYIFLVIMFGIILKIKKKKIPLYHSYFFSHFPKLEIYSESSYLTILTLSYSILQILSFYFKLCNEVFLGKVKDETIESFTYHFLKNKKQKTIESHSIYTL